MQAAGAWGRPQKLSGEPLDDLSKSNGARLNGFQLPGRPFCNTFVHIAPAPSLQDLPWVNSRMSSIQSTLHV